MLTKNQFDILTFLAENRNPITQRDLVQKVSHSLGTVNKILAYFHHEGLIEGTLITEKGLLALEPHRVKKAVFIAAGFGSRMVPVTLNTPKPLVRVKGKRIIDSLLDAVLAAGIQDIVIVRGYLGEQFDQLLYKYPMIRFIENPAYNEANNISSAICARYEMKSAYVFEADLLLYNPDLIKKYQYRSNYLAIPVTATEDWCFGTADNGRITKIGIGGKNCHHMIGVSYWTDEDGGKLAEHLKDVYESPGGKERYWDQVPLEYYGKDYQVFVRKCTFDDVIEIDTYRELKELDESYI